MLTLLAWALWALRAKAKARRWCEAARHAAAAQSEVLLRIVRANGGTEFGRVHGFDAIDSAAAYQERVPLRSFDDFQPYIDRIAAGERRVLTAEDVVRFGLSSGSTAPAKLIPYTPSLLAEFREGIDPFVWRIFRAAPRAMLGKAYWSVTPVGTTPRRSAAGIPIGFDDERPYFDRITQTLLRATMAAPPELAALRDIDAFRYATLRRLLRERSLSWISVWNPTFLTLLLAPLEQWRASLIDDVRRGDPRRARELTRARTCEEIWPRLRLISCWADGAAADAIPPLRRLFPNVAIQPKGLIATEAFVSFPWEGNASALSLRSHFFEFEESGGAIRLAHELRAGVRYSVIVTTSGGLYRNRLHDLVEIVGHVDQCPLLRFVGRTDKVVDLRGEKLNELFVADAVRRTLARHGIAARFQMVAPGEDDAYVLFLQSGSADHIAADLDAALRESFHYDYCRRLGQLAPCRVFRIAPEADAAALYVATCATLGQRLGDIKPAALHPYRQWAKTFPGT